MLIQDNPLHCGVQLCCVTVVESGMAAVNSAVVSLEGPVLFVPEEWSAAQGTEPVWSWGVLLGLTEALSPQTNCLSPCFAGSTLLSMETWAGIAMTAVGVLSLATMLLFLAFLKCSKRRAYTVH